MEQKGRLGEEGDGGPLRNGEGKGWCLEWGNARTLPGSEEIEKKGRGRNVDFWGGLDVQR